MLIAFVQHSIHSHTLLFILYTIFQTKKEWNQQTYHSSTLQFEIINSRMSRQFSHNATLWHTVSTKMYICIYLVYFCKTFLFPYIFRVIIIYAANIFAILWDIYAANIFAIFQVPEKFVLVNNTINNNVHKLHVLVN